MGRKSNIGRNFKIEVCELILSCKKSIGEIASEYNIHYTTIWEWISKYKEHGNYAFTITNRNKSYSKEFKKKVISDYINNHGSLLTIASKYNISKSVVTKWFRMYNNGIELKDYDPKGDVYTMKARHTTFEERLEIVNFVINNNNDYKLTAEKYLLPYSLVYQWTNKYLSNGEESLKFQKRGRKPIGYIEDNLTDIEQLNKEIENLKRQNEYLKLANEVLKKKEEFERQAELQRLGKRKPTKR